MSDLIDRQPTQKNDSNTLDALDCVSRQAAIDAIEEYADRLQMVNWKENPGVPYKVYALNWCINTIRELPSVQPEVTEEAVKDYCRKRCLTVLTNECFHYLLSAQQEPSQVARDIATIIENEKDMRVIASAQPEIIRCKDCKHRFIDGENVRFNVCELNRNKVQSDDWFCADGERGENRNAN